VAYHSLMRCFHATGIRFFHRPCPSGSCNTPPHLSIIIVRDRSRTRAIVVAVAVRKCGVLNPPPVWAPRTAEKRSVCERPWLEFDGHPSRTCANDRTGKGRSNPGSRPGAEAVQPGGRVWRRTGSQKTRTEPPSQRASSTQELRGSIPLWRSNGRMESSVQTRTDV
jgi:hypothetical protein